MIFIAVFIFSFFNTNYICHSKFMIFQIGDLPIMKKYWILLTLSAFLFSCSSKNDKDFYSSAKIHEQKGEKKEAMSEYEKIVQEFPKSSVADSSLFRIAKLEIDNKNYVKALKDFKKLTESYPNSKLLAASFFELGKLYHGKVLKKIPVNESYKTAVDYYKKVFKLGTSNPDAPQALFMAGFLEANELHDYKAAKITYNLFLKTYPNNQLAESAKSELKTLGISPGDILKRAGKITRK